MTQNTTLQINETMVNETKGHIFGESGWYEAYTNNRGRLFRNLQHEYGRCTGRMYRDLKSGGTIVVGWIFEKRVKYSDCKDTYLQSTWVEVREATN